MKNVFFLVGPHGVGKTYIASRMKELDSVTHIDLGPLIRQAHNVFSPDTSLGEWVEEGEKKYGPNFTDIILCKQIERVSKGKNENSTLITGSRSLGGIKFIADRFAIPSPQIIYITAPFTQLKSNYEQREKLHLSDEQFRSILQEEKDMGLEGLEEYAKRQCIYLQNDNTDSFVRTIQNIITKPNRDDRENIRE